MWKTRPARQKLKLPRRCLAVFWLAVTMCDKPNTCCAALSTWFDVVYHVLLVHMLFSVVTFCADKSNWQFQGKADGEQFCDVLYFPRHIQEFSFKGLFRVDTFRERSRDWVSDRVTQVLLLYLHILALYWPLARLWECSQSGVQNNKIFLQKRKFLLFCPPDWLHSHRRVRVL